MHSLEHLKLIRDNPGVYRFISDDQLADILLQLIETKSLFKKAKLEIKNGKDGYTPQAGVDYLSREEQITLIKQLIEAIEVPQSAPGKDGVDGRDGIDGADAELTDDDIQFVVDTVYDALFPLLPEPLSSEDIRDRLELLLGEERLDKSAIKGIEEIEAAITELQQRPQGKGEGGGLGQRQVTNLINAAIAALDTDSTPEFEKVSKNLSSYPYTMTYSGDVLTSIQYTTPSGTITKTLNYTGELLTSVTLSGALPVGLPETTKTITYTGDVITSVSYT